MSVSYKNLSGFQRHIETDETGINVSSFSVRYFPEFKDKLQNISGQTRGFAVPDKFSREITLQGEVSGATGVMAATLTTALTLANDVAVFGDGTGGVYMDEVTESQARGSWRAIDMKLSSDPACA